jgi:hypothetical protein
MKLSSLFDLTFIYYYILYSELLHADTLLKHNCHLFLAIYIFYTHFLFIFVCFENYVQHTEGK